MVSQQAPGKFWDYKLQKEEQSFLGPKQEDCTEPAFPRVASVWGRGENLKPHSADGPKCPYQQPQHSRQPGCRRHPDLHWSAKC